MKPNPTYELLWKLDLIKRCIEEKKNFIIVTPNESKTLSGESVKEIIMDEVMDVADFGLCAYCNAVIDLKDIKCRRCGRCVRCP